MTLIDVIGVLIALEISAFIICIYFMIWKFLRRIESIILDFINEIREQNTDCQDPEQEELQRDINFNDAIQQFYQDQEQEQEETKKEFCPIQYTDLEKQLRYRNGPQLLSEATIKLMNER